MAIRNAAVLGGVSLSKAIEGVSKMRWRRQVHLNFCTGHTYSAQNSQNLVKVIFRGSVDPENAFIGGTK